ncbi:MAG: RNA-binding protein [Mesorhizobium amorphae]|nr:MAG: RNA-binding protein [Mesorhizobium amorphae]
MSFLPLSFGFAPVLFGLLALPVIWWLLRLTPPRPQVEVFPPLKVLAGVLKREETPHRSPWWLTLLRLVLAALVILALAEPVWNPRERVATDGHPLAIVVDNGWSTGPDWSNRVAAAERLIADANEAGAPIVLAFTAEADNTEIGPFDADTALDRLAAAEPRPVPGDRLATYSRAAAALPENAQATVALLTDGLATAEDEQAFQAILGAKAGRLVWASPERFAALGLTGAENEVEGLRVTAVRAADPAPRQAQVGAFDERGRRIADATVSFAPGETNGEALIAVPFELRNDFAALRIDGEPQAAAVRVLDENDKRRRVGLLSQAEADGAQPLLSPLYYIRRALAPFADLVEPSSPDLAQAIPQILERNPAMIVMADVGTIPDTQREALEEWVSQGGTLLRFAGSRLAAAGDDQALLPVRLRLGERALGGSLSWTEPQPVAPFPATGPFAGLPAPQDVNVSRQVLAEPGIDIAERTWASLADGTPLVTGAREGRGTVALFHVTPEATWSNLPISGSFVEMLRRVVQLSRNQGTAAAAAGEQAPALRPFRMIARDGALVPPGPEARPLVPGATAVTLTNPPGLYGGEEGVLAHNLLGSDARFDAIARPASPLPVTEMTYAVDGSLPLKAPFLLAALVLLVVDTLVMLLLGGALGRLLARKSRSVTAAVATVLLAFGLIGTMPLDARAQDAKPGDAEAIAAIAQTRLAYVVTGDAAVDNISKAGLEGLTRFLLDKTALEPAEPVGVDIASDELAFYPLIYWPVDASAAMPEQAAIARVDAYMREGGTVLFDTRDQFTGDLGTGSAANDRLRDILADLNVPPLEPVPEDHVLTKSFFILNSFPGRYAGSPLWVEAALDAQSSGDRPVRTGDGVSPIMITGNDLAGAWAEDASGAPLLPTVPDDPMQRVYAMRAGVNIVMYMLTGNYKSDQVHVPALLERLGQ